MIDLCCSDDGQAINNYLIQNLRKSGDALDEVSAGFLSFFVSLHQAEAAVLLLQVYNSTGRAFPRRFVLPLHITSETPTGQNLNTRASSQATCVKTSKDTVSRRKTGGEGREGQFIVMLKT